MKLFPLGRLVATPAALTLLDAHDLGPLHLLDRHQSGDWGDLGVADRLTNDEALLFAGRVLSRYLVAGQPVWVITEADRSSTTVLLPDEY